MTKKAAEYNEKVLALFKYDLGAAIAFQRDSPVFYGSEFQAVEKLESLLHLHPLWDRMKTYLSKGCTFPLKPISTEDRIADCQFMFDRGNHKSATNEAGAALASGLMQEDVAHGYSLPLPTSCIDKLAPFGSIAPLGVQLQNTLNELGETIPKWRMTHDQSFPAEGSKTSVNLRTIAEELPECRYGRALIRLLHLIVGMRARYPTTPILIGKFDLKAAYRRAHLSPQTTMESMTVLDDLLEVSLRLTFGGSSCPPQWCCISETICDLANDIMHCPAWNPDETHSPLQVNIPPPLRFPADMPFGQAKELSVPIPDNDIGSADVFIDDFLPVALDINDNVKRVGYAVPLAVHSIGRQVSPNEPLPRKDLISLPKLAAEGRMEETKLGLGWTINTRDLSVALPQSKFLGWQKDILATIELTMAFGDELDTLAGLLGHAALILTQMRHFINCHDWPKACRKKSQNDRKCERGSQIMSRVPQGCQRRRLYESAYFPQANSLLLVRRL